MELLIFKGLCSGFFYTFTSISAMILVAHHVIEKGVKTGFIASFGIIIVQFIYALIASLINFGFIILFHTKKPSYILIGSVILFFMAIKIYRNQEKYNQKDQTGFRPLKVFALGFLITLAMPIRILGYTAIFIALKIYPSSFLTLFFPAIGVVLGSFLWWMIYILSIQHRHKVIYPKIFHQFHRYAALIFILFSFIGLLQLFL